MLDRLRKNKIWAISGMIVAVFVILLLLPQARNGLQAVALFTNLTIQEGAWRPLEVFSREPSRESYALTTGSGRTLAIDVYAPAGSGTHPGMLVYVPLAGGGQRDARLVNFAESIAQIGFVVMVPWHEEEATILSDDDVEDLISAFQNLRTHDRVDGRTGFFAISYGNGPVFLAAADERIREHVAFIASYAGYYDLRNAVRYVITGAYEYKDIRETLEPEQWVKDLLKENLAFYGLPPEEINQLFAQPNRFEEILDQYPAAREQMRTFSPAAVTEHILSPTFIAHSRGDRTIPWTEALRLRDALADRVPVTLSVVNIFVHGNLRPLNPTTLRKNYLPSFLSGYAFLYEIVSF